MHVIIHINRNFVTIENGVTTCFIDRSESTQFFLFIRWVIEKISIVYRDEKKRRITNQ